MSDTTHTVLSEVDWPVGFFPYEPGTAKVREAQGLRFLPYYVTKASVRSYAVFAGRVCIGIAERRRNREGRTSWEMIFRAPPSTRVYGQTLTLLASDVAFLRPEVLR